MKRKRYEVGTREATLAVGERDNSTYQNTDGVDGSDRVWWEPLVPGLYGEAVVAVVALQWPVGEDPCRALSWPPDTLDTEQPVVVAVSDGEGDVAVGRGRVVTVPGTNSHNRLGLSWK